MTVRPRFSLLSSLASLTLTWLVATAIPAAAISISGQVTNRAGFVVPGASVALTGSVTASTTTDSSGNFTFNALPPLGSYTVTPTKSRTRFSPATRSFSAPGVNTTANFTSRRLMPPADFDGDGKTDLSVIHRREPNLADPNDSVERAFWKAKKSGGGSDYSQEWGLNSDRPEPSDYDGDGKTDPAYYRSSDHLWHIRESSTGDEEFEFFGFNTDVSIPNDYDGDELADVGAFRLSTHAWFLDQSSIGDYTTRSWGSNGDRIAPGDYDGDGKADSVVWRESDGVWYLLYATGSFGYATFGLPGDRPVPGDYDDDGKTDIALFRPSTSTWYVLRSSDSSTQSQVLGTGGDIPAPGDYDGDGKTDYAVFRPSNNTWIIRDSSTGTTRSPETYGDNGDLPVPALYVP